MGWFYGFKLHLIVSYRGEIVAAKLTSGNGKFVVVFMFTCCVILKI